MFWSLCREFFSFLALDTLGCWYCCLSHSCTISLGHTAWSFTVVMKQVDPWHFLRDCCVEWFQFVISHDHVSILLHAAILYTADSAHLKQPWKCPALRSATCSHAFAFAQLAKVSPAPFVYTPSRCTSCLCCYHALLPLWWLFDSCCSNLSE